MQFMVLTLIIYFQHTCLQLGMAHHLIILFNWKKEGETIETLQKSRLKQACNTLTHWLAPMTIIRNGGNTIGRNPGSPNVSQKSSYASMRGKPCDNSQE